MGVSFRPDGLQPRTTKPKAGHAGSEATAHAAPPGSGPAGLAHGIDLAQYRAALAEIQDTVHADHALQAKPGADGLYLRPGMASIFYAQPTPHARGTILMFHGYTAGPWQYDEMAKQFEKAGYNVYVPRMPGHGLTLPGGKPTGEQLPKTEAEYERFIDKTYKEAQGLGAPVYVVGLSGGGNIALRMAEKYPQVKGAVMLSPYLGGNRPKGLVFDVANGLDKLTRGAFGRFVQRFPFEGNPIEKPGEPTPHTRGSIGQALAMNEVGSRVKRITCPAQFLTSDGDFLSGSERVQQVFQRSGGTKKDGWYRFHANEHVPHAMLSPRENPDPEHYKTMDDIVLQFIEQGKVANRT